MTHPHPSVRVCAYLALDADGHGSNAGAEQDAHGHRALAPTVCSRDRALLLQVPPVSEILAAQYPDGYWMHRDLGISPRYRATVWQLLMLAQLGVGPIADSEMPGELVVPIEIRRAIEVVREDNLDVCGALRLRQDAPSLALTGAILWSLARLEAIQVEDWTPTWIWVTQQLGKAALDPVDAFWLTRAAAAWGREDWLARHRPWRHAAGLSTYEGPLRFPLALNPDALAVMEMWTEVDPYISSSDQIPESAIAWLQGRQLKAGAWPLEQALGPLWCDVGATGAPNPWVTVRALSVLEYGV